MTPTALDRAHGAMAATPEDPRPRLVFYDRLAEAELHLLLDHEAEGGRPVAPRVFPVEGQPVVVAFDLADRLADFAGQAVPCAVLSGRTLAATLAGKGLGLGLNLGAPSEILLPPDALNWLAAALAPPPARIAAIPRAIAPPANLPAALLTALDAKLLSAAGLAAAAALASVTYDDGSRGLLLAFLDAAPGAEEALSGAVAEALVFSGLDEGALDICFLAARDPVAERLGRTGLRIELPAAHRPRTYTAPGMDPANPPRLK